MNRLLGHQDALAEQVKLGATIRHPLDHLESVYLPLDLAVAEWQRERSTYRCTIAFEPRRKALNLRNSRGSCLLKPELKSLRLTLAHQTQESECKRGSFLHHRTTFQQALDIHAVFRFKLIFGPNKEPCNLAG